MQLIIERKGETILRIKTRKEKKIKKFQIKGLYENNFPNFLKIMYDFYLRN